MIVAATLASPCMKCDDRCIGCHTTCGDYAEYKAELERRRKEVKETKDFENFQRDIKARIARTKAERRKGDDR